MYFSDYCLSGEEQLFRFLRLGQYDVAGFGYGAYEAFSFAYNQMLKRHRIHRIVLIAPFFDQENYIKKTQKIYNQYVKISQFLHIEREVSALEWSKKKLREMKQYGADIEVYIGGKSEIGESERVVEFFREFGVVYYLKNFSHLLYDFDFS